nr:PREDICTED: 2-phosphoxylose phosphatase 1 [Bemisia tabaci]
MYVLMKRATQHRAIYCYGILSLWIFLMIAGTYKFANFDNVMSTWLRKPQTLPAAQAQKRLRDLKRRNLLKSCNLLEDLTLGSEGESDENYNLEGVILLLRHGDRGPLSHLRNISSVDCGIKTEESSKEFELYRQIVSNISYKLPQSSMLSFFLSHIQNSPQSPLLPSSPECELGQLTPSGIVQLMKLGQLLRSRYASRLALADKNVTSEDIAVYSTAYKRTIQSVLAFLTTFLNVDDFFKVVHLRESKSLLFCFNDCACHASEVYQKRYRAEVSKFYKNHPSVIKLVRKLSNIVFEVPDSMQNSDPYVLKDGLLTFLCHEANLPSYNLRNVRKEQVTTVFNYINQETRVAVQSQALKMSFLLRSYGFLKDIVSQMLRIISEKKPRMIIYSGHDKTIKYISAAFGILNQFTALPPYASRFMIEVYSFDEKTETDIFSVRKKYFFRLLFNGQDFTDQVTFCKTNFQKDGANNSNFVVCPIESIIRYLHDDYFMIFNATNYKDACAVPT